MWIKWRQIVDINQKRKRNMVDLSFCKQAKWNDPGCNPCGVKREAADVDRAPQRCRSSQRVGMRTRGGATSRESSDQSWQAASHHKRVNSEACGRGSFSCRKLEMKSKVSNMKWGNQAQRGQVTFPRSHRDCQRQHLNSNLLIPSYTSFSFSRDCKFTCLQSQAGNRNARGWPDVGDHRSALSKRNPMEPHF